MSEATNFKPKWTMPETGADIARFAESLMISRARLAEVIGVTTAELNQNKLSGSTQDRLQPLLDVYNRAIWLAEDETKAACWMNHGYPRGLGRGSPLDWIGKGEAEYVKNVQGAVHAGVHA
ncbi:hypothetical protein PF049_14095 (plasmid) [Erythrobacteraceae bacterium WH01K]|nr:hypothetical protein PF049_14095 [Erythrobacteraceae bacterium WH01K]